MTDHTSVSMIFFFKYSYRHMFVQMFADDFSCLFFSPSSSFCPFFIFIPPNDILASEKGRYMVVFHVSTFMLLLHYAGGYLFTS